MAKPCWLPSISTRRCSARNQDSDAVAVPQGRRELDVAALGELPGHLVAEVILVPVGAAVKRSHFAVQLRVNEHQAVDLPGTFGGVVGVDATGEAGVEQAQPKAPRGLLR
jgi:hypothetical protein